MAGLTFLFIGLCIKRRGDERANGGSGVCKRNVRDGRCTFAGVGRATLAQPDFVKQIMDTGRLDRKRVCRTFSYCTALMRSKDNEMGQYQTGCPPFDKEGYNDVWQEVLAKRIR